MTYTKTMNELDAYTIIALGKSALDRAVEERYATTDFEETFEEFQSELPESEQETIRGEKRFISEDDFDLATPAERAMLRLALDFEEHFDSFIGQAHA